MKKYELLIVLAGFAACSMAQTKQPRPFTQTIIPIKGSQQLQEYASFYFDMADYAGALPLYIKLDQRYPDRTDFIFNLGVCYLYKTGDCKYCIISNTYFACACTHGIVKSWIGRCIP